MYQALGHAAILIFCGMLWRRFQPLGMHADTLRQSLTSLVYILLLPALVLLTLWKAELGLDTLRISLTATVVILACLALAWLWYRYRGTKMNERGALILAAGFGNFTYLGLPVLEATLGEWARGVAIQFDLLAATPLLLTLGIMIARHHGEANDRFHPFASLVRVPAIWAALIGIALNLASIPLPLWLARLLHMLGDGVVPLMLISVGLALCCFSGWHRRLGLLFPTLLIQLLLMPTIAYFFAQRIGLDGQVFIAVVLEAAMPTMVLGIVFCDRYKLDSALYAEAVTLSTLLSALTLPLWFGLFSL